MLAGNIAGKTGTISQKIAMVMQNSDYTTAGIWVVIIIVIALVILFLMNLIARGKNNRRW
jgi:molybdate transport system permease protein